MARKEQSTNTINKVLLEKTCNMAYTLSVIEGRWKLTIICQLLLHSSIRFGEIKSKVFLITDKMLTQQLNALIADGLVSKTVVSRKPFNTVYELTEMGKGLEPVLMSLFNWGITFNPLLLRRNKSTQVKRASSISKQGRSLMNEKKK